MSDFDFSTLITDRTSADVSALSELMAKKLETWTPEELEQFNNGLLKGGYWWTDLNRVTACMEYLDEELRSLGYESGYVPVVVHDNGMGLVTLTDGYVQLEYIESTGAQYIDTGIKPGGNTRVHCSANFQTQEAGAWLFGARDRTSTNAYGFLTYKNGYRSDYNSAGSQIPDSYGPELEIDKDGPSTYLNGSLVDSSKLSSFSAKDDLVIGANATSGAVSGFSRAIHRWYKIYNNSVLTRDFVPCKNASGDVGMFDTVTSMFYGNVGTGSFIAGPVYSPDENPDVVDPYTWYKEDSPKIEQLQQYIDNVAAIRSAFDGLKNAPEAPTTPRKITVEIANSIEKILLAVETAIQQTVKGMARSNSFTFWSGNRAFPTAESNNGRDWAGLDAMQTGWRNWQLATWYLLLYGNLKAEGDVV